MKMCFKQALQCSKQQGMERLESGSYQPLCLHGNSTAPAGPEVACSIHPPPFPKNYLFQFLIWLWKVDRLGGPAGLWQSCQRIHPADHKWLQFLTSRDQLGVTSLRRKFLPFRFVSVSPPEGSSCDQCFGFGSASGSCHNNQSALGTFPGPPSFTLLGKKRDSLWHLNG